MTQDFDSYVDATSDPSSSAQTNDIISLQRTALQSMKDMGLQGAGGGAGRLASARANHVRDRTGAEVIDQLEDEYAALCARYPAGPLPGDVAEVGWLLEELRVSLFAQTLGTAAPVSAKRIRTAMAAVRPPSTLAQ